MLYVLNVLTCGSELWIFQLKEPLRSIHSTPRDPRSKSWRDFYTFEKMISFRLNTHPNFWTKNAHFFSKNIHLLILLTENILHRLRYNIKWFPSDETGSRWSPNQARAQQPHDKDHKSYCPAQHVPSKSLEKILFEWSSKPPSTFLWKSVGHLFCSWNAM